MGKLIETSWSLGKPPPALKASSSAFWAASCGAVRVGAELSARSFGSGMLGEAKVARTSFSGFGSCVTPWQAVIEKASASTARRRSDIGFSS